jgi:hypothetical protein
MGLDDNRRFDPTNVLPDSRTRSRLGAVPGPYGYWVPIYCYHCGKQGGQVPEENMTFVCWMCDECFRTKGPLTATMVMPDEVFWEQVKQEQLSTHGRLLTNEELLEIMAADASPLATLLKQGRLIL